MTDPHRMIDMEGLRNCATALPEAVEGTHFTLPAFKVRDKAFAVVQGGGTYAIVHVDQASAAAAAADDPESFEEVWRDGGRIFVGLRVDLARAPAARVQELIVVAWRNKAPKRVVASYDRSA